MNLDRVFRHTNLKSFFNEEVHKECMNTEKKPLAFVNPDKEPEHYIRRYLNESDYKEWFHRNYPKYTIYQGIGISKEEYTDIVNYLTGQEDKQDDTPKTQQKVDGLTKLKELAKQLKGENDTQQQQQQQQSEKPSTKTNTETEQQPPQLKSEDLVRSVFESGSSNQSSSYDRRTFEEFVDERILISRDLFGKKEMKIKILEVSDEHQQSKIRWKFGDRVKVDKIIITIKHLDTMNVEEQEFDIASIEKELAEKRHYSSTNRWIPTTDIKNGYVINSKHTALISDAVALDYIVF